MSNSGWLLLSIYVPLSVSLYETDIYFIQLNDEDNAFLHWLQEIYLCLYVFCVKYNIGYIIYFRHALHFLMWTSQSSAMFINSLRPMMNSCLHGISYKLNQEYGLNMVFKSYILLGLYVAQQKNKKTKKQKK
jgi:hypothetical protein